MLLRVIFVKSARLLGWHELYLHSFKIIVFVSIPRKHWESLSGFNDFFRMCLEKYHEPFNDFEL